MEGEGSLGVVRMADVTHEARYYMLRKARYPENRAEDTSRYKGCSFYFLGFGEE